MADKSLDEVFGIPKLHQAVTRGAVLSDATLSLVLDLARYCRALGGHPGQLGTQVLEALDGT